jgi:hypothetical protein
MTTLYPEVRDLSTLTGVFQADQFLAIGVEGDMDNTGTATVGHPYVVNSAEEARTRFGTNSSLAALVTFILSRGIASVTAVGTDLSHELSARQTSWAALEDDRSIRVRLTDGVLQSEIAALANSCEYAEEIQNKQFCVVGIASPTTKSGLSTAAAAVASKRAVLVGPGIYDLDGSLRCGRLRSRVRRVRDREEPQHR